MVLSTFISIISRFCKNPRTPGYNAFDTRNLRAIYLLDDSNSKYQLMQLLSTHLVNSIHLPSHFIFSHDMLIFPAYLAFLAPNLCKVISFFYEKKILLSHSYRTAVNPIFAQLNDFYCMTLVLTSYAIYSKILEACITYLWEHCVQYQGTLRML